MLATLRRRLLRPWAILPLAALVGGTTWLVSRPSGDDAEAATVTRTVEVTTGPLSLTVAASGTIEAATTDQLSFAAAGTVTAVHVAAGDEVAAGDVLATIDSAELQAAVAQADASVADAQAQLDGDQDAGASATQLAADETALASAQAQLTAAQEALAGAQLVATVDGTVSAVNVAVGEELGGDGTSGSGLTGSGTPSGQSSGTLGGDDQAGGGTPTTTGDTSTSTEPHVEVVSTGSYTVTLDVDDTQVANLEVGQEATITLADADAASTDAASTAADSAGTSAGEVTGSVTSVGAIADASSGVATYPVVVAFEGSAEDVHVGAPADVAVTYDEVADAVQVPTPAVSTEGGTSTVTVATDGGEEERTVETGLSAGGMTQVTSGLEAGEQVVITLAAPGDRAGVTGGGAEDERPAGFGPGGGGGFAPPDGFVPGGGAVAGGGAP